MLGTRTKQVQTYGKRGRRIVNVSDRRSSPWGEPSTVRSIASEPQPTQTDREHPFVLSSPPRAKRIAKKIKQLSPASSSPSPAIAAKVIRKRQVISQRKTSPVAASPPRAPLASVPPNVADAPGYSAGWKKSGIKYGVKGVPSNLRKPRSPVVAVDIVVMDGDKKVSEEKRITRTDVDTNPVRTSPFPIKAAARPPPAAKPKASLIITDSEDDKPDLPRAKAPVRRAALPKPNRSPIVITDTEDELPRPKRASGKRAKPQVISSDSEDSLPSPKTLVQQSARRHAPKLIFEHPPYQPPKAAQSTFQTPLPNAAKPIHKLTPIRYQTVALFPHAASPPSPTTPSDFDLSLDFSELALAATPTPTQPPAPAPAYLRPLLAECNQASPHEFSAFIETFPFDAVVRPLDTPPLPPPAYTFRKIGEASYSEVFGIGDVVLKIVPLRDEDTSKAGRAETPPPSDARDVLREIVVTRAMGEMCAGFVRLLRAYVVRGRYPSLLLDLWDAYDATKGSESVRPDNFVVAQTYAIIVLPNGGPDLEAYAFAQPARTGWRQACSLFWQVTRALADAERLVSFEHRDLHWGQILVKNTSAGPPRRAARNKVRMDSPAHGVAVTIIDLGLSRMDAGDRQGAQTHWTPFEEETFEGEGDYQFDIYRMMRAHIGTAWTAFRPLTNVMWLHYLALKLLQSKRLNPPASRKTSALSEHMFTERECYECLVEVEQVLASVVSPFNINRASSAQKGRRKAPGPSQQVSGGPRSAGDVLGYAARRGWVN
ncbi:hypothetical protein OE88DRAFT_1765645 [Heliocybe sulcata]|uniref:non-specific serine/threonine protein kinase n=1 Tax=Heliocybe sulcata TaxID=5364 RepID=A0A5C3NF14_9AGAM|nr:hypothetical protein OE88DRAFT_1765645 [Heliocybe sulcata]